MLEWKSIKANRNHSKNIHHWRYIFANIISNFLIHLIRLPKDRRIGYVYIWYDMIAILFRGKKKSPQIIWDIKNSVRHCTLIAIHIYVRREGLLLLLITLWLSTIFSFYWFVYCTMSMRVYDFAETRTISFGTRWMWSDVSRLNCLNRSGQTVNCFLSNSFDGLFFCLVYIYIYDLKINGFSLLVLCIACFVYDNWPIRWVFLACNVTVCFWMHLKGMSKAKNGKERIIETWQNVFLCICRYSISLKLSGVFFAWLSVKKTFYL